MFRRIHGFHCIGIRLRQNRCHKYAVTSCRCVYVCVCERRSMVLNTAGEIGWNTQRRYNRLGSEQRGSSCQLLYACLGLFSIFGHRLFATSLHSSAERRRRSLHIPSSLKETMRFWWVWPWADCPFESPKWTLLPRWHSAVSYAMTESAIQSSCQSPTSTSVHTRRCQKCQIQGLNCSWYLKEIPPYVWKKYKFQT